MKLMNLNIYIGTSILKKCEMASKICQGVTFKRILDNYRNCIDTNLKQENSIT